MTQNAELNSVARKKLYELKLFDFLKDGYVVLAASGRPFSPKNCTRSYTRWQWNLHVHNKKLARGEKAVLVKLGKNEEIVELFVLPKSATGTRKTVAVYTSDNGTITSGWLRKYSYPVPSSL